MPEVLVCCARSTVRPVPFRHSTSSSAHNSVPIPTRCTSARSQGDTCAACGCALENVDSGNGHFVLLPGLATAPRSVLPAIRPLRDRSYDRYEVAQEALLEARRLEPIEEFHAKAGDILIWSANLVHGGKPITEERAHRWSQVTHYFFDGCVYVTPFTATRRSASGSSAPVWYRHWRSAAQSYNDEPVHFEDLGNGRSQPNPCAGRTAPSAEQLAEMRRAQIPA